MSVAVSVGGKVGMRGTAVIWKAISGAGKAVGKGVLTKARISDGRCCCTRFGSRPTSLGSANHAANPSAIKMPIPSKNRIMRDMVYFIQRSIQKSGDRGNGRC